jgi:D-sedoheptulose 7-phosphate isomerase
MHFRSLTPAVRPRRPRRPRQPPRVVRRRSDGVAFRNRAIKLTNLAESGDARASARGARLEEFGVTGPSQSYFDRLLRVISTLDREALDRSVELVRTTWLEGRQIITLGNGGSAMTALHFITDWNKMIHLATGKPFRGRTLVDNMGLITAYGNDISFQDIFAEQLKNISSPDDLVIAISGSGNSENVIRAVNYANSAGCRTLGLCGFDGGRLKTLAKQVVWVNVNDMQICEDVHAIFGHIVMKTLCKTG